MLCAGCGNEIEQGEDCPVCAGIRERREAERRASLESTFCPSCGNEIYGEAGCPICHAGRAHRRQSSRTRSLCPGCGNEVESGEDCPVCREGRAPVKVRRKGASICPQCDSELETQDWEGVIVRMCPDCQGSLFPPDGLEQALDHLRGEDADTDMAAVIAEFCGRPRCALPKSVRYKACPTCGNSMLRRNYAGVSGVIVDVCGVHGTWVDQAAFGELADFVSRGGDLFAARSPLRKGR